MSVNSRAKGAAGERECAKFLAQYGYETRRGQQFKGGPDSPDVVGVPGVHAEVKRVERLNIEDAMAQAIRDAAEGEVPVVMHRKNNCKWLATLRLSDFMELYGETGRGEKSD